MELAPLGVSILLILFAAFDIMHHISSGDSYGRILTGTVVFFLGFLMNLFFVHRAARQVSGLETSNRRIRDDLQLSVQEIEQLKLERQRTQEGLHRAIEEQLKVWGLSPSEIEIAFLVLKGLSNKQIAEVRQTSESTVRLQCSSIYKKSKLTSRSELAAYFLEDIL
jgi:DNA-binding CsgD family transcriptional regulator